MKNNNLHTIKSPGFKTPDAYFESLVEVVFSKLIQDQLSTVIDSSGFEVPNGYFESLDAKILEATKESHTTKIIHLFSWKKVSYISGIAASMILAFNLIFTNSTKVTFDSLKTASIETYLMNEDLNAYDIAPYLSVKELSTDDFVKNTLYPSDIEDYLLQNSDVEHLLSDQ
ncbi:MAG: hypothetical protein ABIO60_05315 [Aquaticitalea sp.]